MIVILSVTSACGKELSYIQCVDACDSIGTMEDFCRLIEDYTIRGKCWKIVPYDGREGSKKACRNWCYWTFKTDAWTHLQVELIDGSGKGNVNV
jgi:hypothetical protein